MSLNLDKLQNPHHRGSKTTYRCPACAEIGRDNKGEHLILKDDGRFGCVLYPGNSAESKEHRRRIFALCGETRIKPLQVRWQSLGRLGRHFSSPRETAPVQTGILGRLGRQFLHLRVRREEQKQLSVISRGVEQNPSHPSHATLHRPLSDHELSLLRLAGREDDPLILEAIEIFNATVTAVSNGHDS